VDYFVVGGFDLSRDTDNFRSEIYSAGGGIYLNNSKKDRIGYRRIESHYSSPGYSAHGQANAVFGNVVVDEKRSAEISGELTSAELDNGKNRWLGWGQFAAQPTTLSNVELRYESNWVDSRNALDNGIAYRALTVAGDYQFTNRFNLAGVIGHLSFSDSNERPLYRAKATYLLSEIYGVNTYVRARRYSNSDPYSGKYFSPEHYYDYLGGIGIRKRLPFVRGTVVGNIDWGRQVVDGVESPARTWQIRLESWIGQRFTYSIGAGFNATAGVGGGDDYEYRYTSCSLGWRF
jgi:hypothetical protein